MSNLNNEDEIFNKTVPCQKTKEDTQKGIFLNNLESCLYFIIESCLIIVNDL